MEAEFNDKGWKASKDGTSLRCSNIRLPGVVQSFQEMSIVTHAVRQPVRRIVRSARNDPSAKDLPHTCPTTHQHSTNSFIFCLDGQSSRAHQVQAPLKLEEECRSTCTTTQHRYDLWRQQMCIGSKLYYYRSLVTLTNLPFLQSCLHIDASKTSSKECKSCSTQCSH